MWKTVWTKEATTTSHLHPLTTLKVSLKLTSNNISNLLCFIDEAEVHKFELEKLAEKDPEFYKYLQENDEELLHFNGEDDDDEMEEDFDGGDDEDTKAPSLTKEHLRIWQKALLEVCLLPNPFVYTLIA